MTDTIQFHKIEGNRGYLITADAVDFLSHFSLKKFVAHIMLALLLFVRPRQFLGHYIDDNW